MHSPDGSYVGGSCQRMALTGGGRWRRLVLLPGVSCLVPAPDAWASSQETTGACNMAFLQTGTPQNTAPTPAPSTHSDFKTGRRVHRVAASYILHLEK